jgi:hypothetical protein
MLLAALCLLTCVALAHWGPGTHLEYAARVHRRRGELSAGRAALVDGCREAFEYGNLAADIINFKAWGGHYNHCHRWTIVDEMRAHADSDRDEAFILGYLAHLAADTIAHNHFVPYHLARYRRGPKGLGHLFWELSADRFVDDQHWARIGELKRDDRLTELDELVNRTVARKALSMRTNKLLFDHVLLVSERDAWRSRMQRMLPRERTGLDPELLERFRSAATERVMLALTEGGVEKLNQLDTNGKRAQAEALAGSRGSGRGEAAREALSDAFLEGMQSPPPDAHEPPHWPLDAPVTP